MAVIRFFIPLDADQSANRSPPTTAITAPDDASLMSCTCWAIRSRTSAGVADRASTICSPI